MTSIAAIAYVYGRRRDMRTRPIIDDFPLPERDGVHRSGVLPTGISLPGADGPWSVQRRSVSLFDRFRRVGDHPQITAGGGIRLALAGFPVAQRFHFQTVANSELLA